MSEDLQNLNDNLREQTSLYNKLLSLEEKKKDALIKNNIQEIELITAQEEVFILHVNRLEKERLMWAEQIGRELGKPPEELTLAEIVDHYPLLSKVSLDLDQIVVKLKEVNEINSQLLQQAMKIVNFTFGMLTHQQDNTYTHPDRKAREGNGKRHLLDQSI